MRGKINAIRTSAKNGLEFGFIDGVDGESYYFDSRSLSDDKKMTDYYKGDTVEFSVFERGDGKKSALCMIYVEPKATTLTDDLSVTNANVANVKSIVEYYTPGYYRHMDRERMRTEHLKENSGEYEVLNKLKEVLYISHVGHHEMGGSNVVFPFCLIGATENLKQFIRGQYEFLLVFSHFDSCDWQQNTLRAVKFIRQRKEIVGRRPLINFYLLVSNARNLKEEIDKMKGGTEAAIIPFSFSEILSCTDASELTALLLSRFAEYMFENNMLGEENPIEEDQLLFGDRGKIADAIVQRCLEGKHSGIFGLRRSGKSSVLKAVTRRLEYAGIKYLYVEARSFLEGVDSWKTALFDIAKDIRRVTLSLVQEDETRSEFAERLRLSSTEEDYNKRPSQCFVEDVKHYIKDESVFVLAIDEIELITYNTASSSVWQSLEAYKGFWGALRDSGCSLIVCGVNATINERSIIEYQGNSCDNPMYERIHNCAEFSKTYLPVFTDEQTKTMINTLGGYSNVAFDNIYVDINRAFGGQPYAIRQFCSFIFENIKEHRIPNQLYEISKPTYTALISDFNNSEKGVQVFNTILQHIIIYKSEYEMLKKLALSPDKYRKIEHKDISLIDHLEKYGLIEYDKTTFYITFNIKSIQEYICKAESKAPQDMTNDERRQYIQDKVHICETKLKKYLLNYYTYNGGDAAGISLLNRYMSGSKPTIYINPKANPRPVPSLCRLRDYFDHKLFIMYFSTLKKLIRDNWSTLGRAFETANMGKDKFCVSMDELNAGRTDADHYDPEDMTCPNEWQISDIVMNSFITSYEAFEALFDSLNL